MDTKQSLGKLAWKFFFAFFYLIVCMYIHMWTLCLERDELHVPGRSHHGHRRRAQRPTQQSCTRDYQEGKRPLEIKWLILKKCVGTGHKYSIHIWIMKHTCICNVYIIFGEIGKMSYYFYYYLTQFVLTKKKDGQLNNQKSSLKWQYAGETFFTSS